MNKIKAKDIFKFKKDIEKLKLIMEMFNGTVVNIYEIQNKSIDNNTYDVIIHK